jgi:integrase
MGIKNPKGKVSVENYKGRLRLRWRYQSKRYSLNLTYYSQTNLLLAQKTALQIEHDMLTDGFDMALLKYGGTQKQAEAIQLSFVELFETWVKEYKQMDCEIHTNYNSTRNMIKKWGKVCQKNVLHRLNAETFCSGTYNRRLTILKNFISWLIIQGLWEKNPLLEVHPKKAKKIKQAKREPFTELEIRKILNAFKHNVACSKYSSVPHPYYYPFVYFLFKTGVRNAEAIGLRVSSIDLSKNTILIKEVLARTLKSTAAVNRIRKETKNGKERLIPLTKDLSAILKPIIENKLPDDLVFLSPTGKAIDDNNFQRRIFKKVLKKLKIKERVLYAARHTFNSRCIDAGMTPVMTSFLMGNNPETALRNYTHQISLPKDLPSISEIE